jgi:hypothetical protein
MFDLTKTHFSLTLEKQVATAQTVNPEGTLLMSVLESGEERVLLSAGAGTDVPCGFAISDNQTIATDVAVEEVVNPSAIPYTIQLEHTDPVGSGATKEVRCYNDTAAAEIGTQVATAGAVSAGDEFFLSPTGLLTLHSSIAGASVTVWYRYNMTVAEAVQKYYDRSVNNTASAIFNQVGVGGGTGEIYTSEFVMSEDWSAGTTIYSGANGKVTLSAGGADMSTQLRVIHVPSVDDPFLGLAFKSLAP